MKETFTFTLELFILNTAVTLVLFMQACILEKSFSLYSFEKIFCFNVVM